MFGWFEDAAHSTLNVLDDIVEGEAPSKRDVAKLADAGLSIAAIAMMTGFTVEAIESFLSDD